MKAAPVGNFWTRLLLRCFLAGQRSSITREPAVPTWLVYMPRRPIDVDAHVDRPPYSATYDKLAILANGAVCDTQNG